MEMRTHIVTQKGSRLLLPGDGVIVEGNIWSH